MAGISAIGLGAYINRMSHATGGQPLTHATKAKLEALGVDTTNIKTEAEGKAMLIAVQAERSDSVQKSKKSNGNQQDEVMRQVKLLADKLNVTYSDNDTVDDIIYRITAKVEKLISEAGDDEKKQADATYYNGRLNEVKRMQKSQIDLAASMNASASMNIAFHGLY